MTSQAEHAFLKTLITEDHDTWVGGKDTDSGIGRTWIWADNEPFSYSPWKHNHPEDVTNKNCIALTTPGFKFRDKECDQNRQYICKLGKINAIDNWTLIMTNLANLFVLYLNR